MKVIVALNGSITSEASALLALHYCRLYGYELLLLHIRNPKDPESEVIGSMETIETLAEAAGIECGRLFLFGKGITPLERYLQESRVDTLFCTSRAQSDFFTSSFSDRLTRRPLPCDVAIVRVADLARLGKIEKIALSIRDARLSVEKFTFFSSLIKAISAEGEIFSVSVFGKSKRSGMGFMEARTLLEELDERLSHYRRLSRLQGTTLRLRHAVCDDETDEILHRSSNHGYDLLIVGGARLGRRFFFRRESPLETLMRHSGVNLIAFYPRSLPHG